jgi:regulator of sigma D
MVSLVHTQEIRPELLEVGSKTHLKYFTIYIRIFASNDGQRLDLSDWLFEKLEDDTNYYSYTITNGAISAKVLTGKIVITRWLDNRKELINTENLIAEDRYRHLLSFEVLCAT